MFVFLIYNNNFIIMESITSQFFTYGTEQKGSEFSNDQREVLNNISELPFDVIIKHTRKNKIKNKELMKEPTIKDIHKEINKNVLSEFLETTFVNVTSKKRVDRLHHIVAKIFVKQNPKYKHNKIIFEHKIGDAYNGTFALDICILDPSNNPLIVILVKCCNSSIGKNMKNNANTIIAEAVRCTHHVKNDTCQRNSVEKVYFVNIFPRKAPKFTMVGQIKSKVSGIDDVQNYLKRSNITPALTHIHGDLVQNINVFYDIKGVDCLLYKHNFEKIIPINIDSIIFDPPP